jgi:hypothetical protein
MLGKPTILAAVLIAAAAFAAGPAAARADDDAVTFFGNIDVTPDKPVHDAVCFFCSVRVEGKVNHDMVVFFGNVRLDGQVGHDSVSFFSSVRATDNSAIGHDMVSFFTETHLGENVSVGHDLVSMLGAVHAPQSVEIGHDRVQFPGLFVSIPGLVIFIVVVVVICERRAHRRRMMMQGYPKIRGLVNSLEDLEILSTAGLPPQRIQIIRQGPRSGDRRYDRLGYLVEFPARCCILLAPCEETLHELRPPLKEFACGS